ncbi:TetR/AcrR family transcriptional regulator [Nocardioides jishulii]|nr:TetR/AcrR family transcriptional regulator [Nocardioides jishulii]
MTGAERREQLITIGRGIFAERGFEGTAIEEVASRAGVSKPVVYEHFGGKEGLYAVVVDREVTQLLLQMRSSLSPAEPRALLESSALALLTYIEESPDGFRIIVRDSPRGAASSTFQSIIGDVGHRVEGILAEEFTRHGLQAEHSPMYAQMLIGMTVTLGQWWLDTRSPDKTTVAAHLVNLAWNGLTGLQVEPELRTERP